MVKRESTAPFLFFILDLPSGISSGFASITLPFILTQAGFSVAAAGYIVALGVSANLWRFLWGPVADFTLSAALVFNRVDHDSGDAAASWSDSPSARFDRMAQCRGVYFPSRKHFGDAAFGRTNGAHR